MAITKTTVKLLENFKMKLKLAALSQLQQKPQRRGLKGLQLYNEMQIIYHNSCQIKLSVVTLHQNLSIVSNC